jgi:hypothetical protein
MRPHEESLICLAGQIEIIKGNLGEPSLSRSTIVGSFALHSAFVHRFFLLSSFSSHFHGVVASCTSIDSIYSIMEKFIRTREISLLARNSSVPSLSMLELFLKLRVTQVILAAASVRRKTLKCRRGVIGKEKDRTREKGFNEGRPIRAID